MKRMLLAAACCVGFLTSAATADESILLERQQKLDAALEKVSPALVSVQDGFGAGSGVIVSADGIVLTASHVVETRRRRNPSITIVFSDGSKYNARLLGMNRNADAAMLKITESYRRGSEFPHVKLGRTSTLKKGAWCFALGHPGGFRKDRPAPVRLGRVLSIGYRTIVSDCAIVLGDSGGPLFDLSGELIGIHSMITEVIVENRHVAIDVFRRDGDRMEGGESWGKLEASDSDLVETRFVGLVLRWRSFTPEVSTVIRNSPGDKCGIRPGDILIEIAGQPFADPLGLSSLLRQIAEFQEVTVVVDRNGEERELKLVTGEKPTDRELNGRERQSVDIEDRDHFIELKNQLTSLRRVGPYEKRTPEELSLFEPSLRDQRRSVVEIREFGETLALGTVMSRDGYILTKASELDGAIKPEVLLSNGRRLAMQELAIDRSYDLMLLKVAANDLSPVQWTDASPVKAGRIVITTDSRGKPLLPGVVSVATRKLATSKKGFLGVKLMQLYGPQRTFGGVQIQEVIPGGAAQRSGIREKDRVLSVNGENINRVDSMMYKISSYAPNSKVQFRIERDNVIKTVDVVLTPRFLEEGGDVMLERYREIENLGKFASNHNSGFPEALQHDTDLFPHQCGGPLFDVTGKAIGLNIARAARITSYALPASAVRKVFAELKAKPAPAKLKRAS